MWGQKQRYKSFISHSLIIVVSYYVLIALSTTLFLIFTAQFFFIISFLIFFVRYFYAFYFYFFSFTVRCPAKDCCILSCDMYYLILVFQVFLFNLSSLPAFVYMIATSSICRHPDHFHLLFLFRFYFKIREREDDEIVEALNRYTIKLQNSLQIINSTEMWTSNHSASVL